MTIRATLAVAMAATFLASTGALAIGGGTTGSSQNNTGSDQTTAQSSKGAPTVTDNGNGTQTQTNKDCTSASAKMTNGQSETCK